MYAEAIRKALSKGRRRSKLKFGSSTVKLGSVLKRYSPRNR